MPLAPDDAAPLSELDRFQAFFDACNPETHPEDFGLSDNNVNHAFDEAARLGLRLRAFRDTGFGVEGALAFGLPFHLGPPGRGRMGFTAECWTGCIRVSRANGVHVADCATWAEVALAIGGPGAF